jgi:hypothetical protein
MPQVTESFEGLSASANASFVEPGYLAVGALSPFTFASGLQYVAPVPNVEPAVHEGTLVGDFRFGNPDWGLVDNGFVSEADVPHGFAFIASQAPVGGMTFAFPQPVYSVSAYVNSAYDIVFTLLDASGNVIGSSVAGSVPAELWHRNFFEVRSPVPIAKVTITGSYVVVDKLSFNTDLSLNIFGTKQDDKISPSQGAPGQALPGAGSDYIRGRGGDDRLFGGDGSDSLFGDKGSDKLRGGAHDDFIYGGKGGDSLFGNEGQDLFFFWESLSQPSDKLKDFSPNEDSVILDSHIYTALDQGLLGNATFDKYFDYRGKTGWLLYDDDGKGGDRPIHIATLPKHLDLPVESFYVV